MNPNDQMNVSTTYAGYPKNIKTFWTKRDYRSLVAKAKEFAYVLAGDAGYEKPEVNRVALESMLVGWMRSRPKWVEYEGFCRERFPRTNLFLLAQDQAIQASQDALFEEPGELITWFCTVGQLNQMV